MGYKALYRTYRPQTFDEVAGQKQIIQTLILIRVSFIMMKKINKVM